MFHSNSNRDAWPGTALSEAWGFDPYRAWLGVHGVRRPLNAYELLSLPSLEDDEETIRTAVGLKRAAMQAHRDEADPDIWEQVSEELDEAIDILLDPHRKAAYDLHLQVQQQTQAGSPGALGAVTERSRGAALSCRRCRTANPATRRFCAQCGANLWEPCPRCGTLCSGGERYCGACGANLGGAIAEQVEQFDRDLGQVEQMVEESRFDEAIARLAPISKADHPRLTEHAARAGQWIKQLAAQRDRRKIVAEDAFARAQTYYADRNYEEAARVIADVPAALRSREMQQLFAEAGRLLDETRALSRELDEAAAGSPRTGLLPKLERLLELRPDDQRAREVAARLQQGVCRAAKTRLARCAYAEARSLLERIPATLRTEEAATLLAHAVELDCLDFDLRHAPVADTTLLALAARLRKLMPTDQRAAKLAKEIERRLEAAKAGSASRIVPWAAPPEQTALGVPVDWAPQPRGIQVADRLDRAAWDAHPGRFFVACGLALQGIEQAKLNINLLPRERAGILGLMTRRIRLRHARSAWGLDLGDSALKAVKLAWSETGRQAVLEACALIEHRKPLSQAANQAEAEALAEDAIKQLLDVHKLQGDAVAVGFPGRLVLTRHLDLPLMDAAKLPKVIQYEARSQVPCDLGELSWGYQLLDQAAPTARNHPAADHDDESFLGQRALLLAVKHQQAARHLRVFRRLNVDVHLLQSESAALLNWWMHESERDSGSADSPHRSPSATAAAESIEVLIDLGSDGTNVAVRSPGNVWFRSVGFGAQAFTRALVQEFRLTWAQSEQLKRDPGKAQRLSQLQSAWAGLLEDLLGELRLSLASVEKAFPGRPVRRVVGLGGGILLHGLVRYLRHGR